MEGSEGNMSSCGLRGRQTRPQFGPGSDLPLMMMRTVVDHDFKQYQEDEEDQSDIRSSLLLSPLFSSRWAGCGPA